MQSGEFYIARDKLVKDILSKLWKNGRLLLVGDAGMGKTVATKLLENEFIESYEVVHEYTGMELEISKGATINAPLSNSGRRSLMIVDGLDQIVSSDLKERLLKFVLSAKGGNVDFLFVTRPSSDVKEYRKYFTAYQMPLLTQEEVVKIFHIHGLVPEQYAGLLPVINNNSHNNIPLIVSTFASLSKRGIGSKDIASFLKNDINYSNNILHQAIHNNRIVIPEPPKIITDVRVINNSLIEKVKRTPNGMHGISSRQFEELVAELFEREGYKVILTKQTHDGGKDLFILEERRVGKFMYYVECKRNSPSRPVGVNIIRELYGSVMADRVTAGIVVTSSYFSDPAKEFTDKVSHQMSLIDYAELNEWMKEVEG